MEKTQWLLDFMAMHENSIFCSICTLNYLAYAKVLNYSLRKAEANVKHYVLIVDAKHSDYKLLENTNFIPVLLEDLKIKNIKQLIQKYSSFELCNILKPFLFEWLLREKKAKIVTYLDTDIFVYSPLTDVYNYLEANPKTDLVITPHLYCSSQYLVDNSFDKERLYTLAGLYNGGFYVLKNSTNVLNFLKWHKSRLVDYGYNAVQRSMFVDQKILDFAPVLFDYVGIYKNIAYNVGHWSLYNGKLDSKFGNYYINSKKIIFFHFSQLNYDRENIENSRLFDLVISRNPVLQKMVTDYWNSLLKNDHNLYMKKSYRFQRLYKKPPLSFVDPLDDLDNRLEQTKEQLEQTKGQLQTIYKSRSWRMTTTIKKFISRFK